MAYMVKDDLGEGLAWRGPYPSKAGDFCGNDDPRAPGYRGDKEGYRTGRPSSCPAGTSEEMAATGAVGLYLDVDKPVKSPHEVIELDTDVLTEAVVTGDRDPEKPIREEDWK